MQINPESVIKGTRTEAKICDTIHNLIIAAKGIKMKDTEQPAAKSDMAKPKSDAVSIPQRERSMSASSTGSSTRILSMTDDSYTGSPIVQGKRLWKQCDASLCEQDVSSSFAMLIVLSSNQLLILFLAILAMPSQEKKEVPWWIGGI